MDFAQASILTIASLIGAFALVFIAIFLDHIRGELMDINLRLWGCELPPPLRKRCAQETDTNEGRPTAASDEDATVSGLSRLCASLSAQLDLEQDALRETMKSEDALKRRVVELEFAAEAKVEYGLSVHPKFCPVTGRPFFMTIEDEAGHMVATYGGPFDSYTIPKWSAEDKEFRSKRFDSDAGRWVEGGAAYDFILVDKQGYRALEEMAL